MAVPASARTWRARTASAVGAGHRRDGVPGQDYAIGFGPGLSGDCPMVLAAVADGHGDARHFRSARGSRFAVGSASEVFRTHAASLAAVASAEQRAALLENLVVPAILGSWTAKVTADLASDPIGRMDPTDSMGPMDPIDASRPRDSASRQCDSASTADPESFAYGSTLLVAAIVGTCALFAQIGDGDLVAVRPDGRALLPVPAVSAPDGRSTASLCLPDAREHFRTAALDLIADPLFAVFAATDGFGDAQILEDWQGAVAADLVRLAAQGGPDRLLGEVAGWAAACASSRGSGDDTSVGLLLDVSAAVADPPAHRRIPLEGGR